MSLDFKIFNSVSLQFNWHFPDYINWLYVFSFLDNACSCLLPLFSVSALYFSNLFEALRCLPDDPSSSVCIYSILPSNTHVLHNQSSVTKTRTSMLACLVVKLQTPCRTGPSLLESSLGNRTWLRTLVEFSPLISISSDPGKALALPWFSWPWHL